MREKLHLGCGERRLEGYTNIDIVGYPNVDLVQDVRVLPSIKDNSVETIYVCHVLEHFPYYSVPWILKRWYSVLAKGGILRLSVPNFEALLEIYQKTGDIKDILGPLYGKKTKTPEALEQAHMCCYTRKLLGDLLASAGFSTVLDWSPKKVFVGKNEGFDDYSQAYFPHMDETGILVSLNLEAVK